MQQEISIAGGDTATPLNLEKRFNIITSGYSGPTPPRFLDCGCGAGDYVLKMAAHGWDARGVEFLEDKIQKARSFGLGADRVIQGDLEHLPYEDENFDVLLFNEVLEHVPDDAAALKEAFRILKSGGEVFIFSPNRFYPFESHGVYVKGTQKKLPVWTPLIPWIPVSLGNRFFTYWARNYWPSELKAKVRQAGFDIKSSSFVWQTFEGISHDTASWLRHARPKLRKVSAFLEKLPVINRFGVSQFIHARKP